MLLERKRVFNFEEMIEKLESNHGSKPHSLCNIYYSNSGISILLRPLMWRKNEESLKTSVLLIIKNLLFSNPKIWKILFFSEAFNEVFRLLV